MQYIPTTSSPETATLQIVATDAQGGQVVTAVKLSGPGGIFIG